jgi:hypothetical protein
VLCIKRRLTYQEALECARRSSAAIVLEAIGSNSPFFPAKLADYLGLGIPILGLSPAESVTADVLGRHHPLRVDPDDVAGIARAFDVLWTHHQRDSLPSLAPAPAARHAVAAPAVEGALNAVLASLVARNGHSRTDLKEVRHA